MKRPRQRLTIGVLAGYQVYEGTTPSRFLGSVFRGIQAAAYDHGCSLLLACGVGHVIGMGQFHPAWPIHRADSDFVPVGADNCDGLIVMVPLRSAERSVDIQRLRQAGYPVVFVGTGEEGPAVVTDNAGGIRLALEHLHRHGHRQVAFIAGDPSDPGDSALRQQAYRDVMAELGLEDEPGLIAHGCHNVVGGYQAMREIIGRAVPFSAVLASNDLSAVGAMRALREAGRHIPDEVAVVGFDDQPQAAAHVPPLASVRFSLSETGYQALELLLRYIRGEQAAPEVVCIPPRMVPRQSCGCLPAAVRTAGLGDADPLAAPKVDCTLIEELAVAMQAALSASDRQPDVAQRAYLCHRMAESFVHSVRAGDADSFQKVLMELLLHLEATDSDVHSWQEIVSSLRCGLPAVLGPHACREAILQAEDLLHQARIAISESAQHRDRRHSVEYDGMADRVCALTTRIYASLDAVQVLRTLQQHLPDVGVARGDIFFLEGDEGDPVAMSRPGLAGSDEADAKTFPSRRFPPAGLYPPEVPLNLALLPLVFQEEQLGWVAFDAQNIEPCAAIVRELGVALKSAWLHARVLELSLTDSLTGVHNRRYLELFLPAELERARRYQHSLSLILLDLDRFKRYNDTWGHPAGDEALRVVARCILTAVREGSDVVVRYGGEEFIVILPETGPEEARVVAERIRAGVVRNRDFKSRLTVSLGVATDDGAAGTVATLVQRADRALYEAKRRGRNQVCWLADHDLVEGAPPAA